VSKPRLRLDADASSKALADALRARGHDVTRTPTERAPVDASDEEQVLSATTRGRCLFTFNVRDYLTLAERHPQHAGIILAFQRSWSLTELVKALARLLSAGDSQEWVGRVRWLNDWRD